MLEVIQHMKCVLHPKDTTHCPVRQADQFAHFQLPPPRVTWYTTLSPKQKPKSSFLLCSLTRITFIVYTNASSQMPKSLHKPKKKLLPTRYTWEEKNVTFLAPAQA